MPIAHVYLETFRRTCYIPPTRMSIEKPVLMRAYGATSPASTATARGFCRSASVYGDGAAIYGHNCAAIYGHNCAAISGNAAIYGDNTVIHGGYAVICEDNAASHGNNAVIFGEIAAV
eukprot:3583475-Rhodomonas_salina.2